MSLSRPITTLLRSKFGFKKKTNTRRLKDIPELNIAVISESEDNLEVNHITDKKTKIGNKK